MDNQKTDFTRPSCQVGLWEFSREKPGYDKRALGRKAMTNLDSVLKSRDITFDKSLSSQSNGFSSSYVSDVRVGA